MTASNTQPTIEPNAETDANPTEANTTNDSLQQSSSAAIEPEEPNQESDVPATAQIRQPLQGPEQSIPSVAIPDIQSEQVEVKTEMGDVPMIDAQGPSNDLSQQGDAHAVSIQQIYHYTKSDRCTLQSLNEAKESSTAPSPAKQTLKPKAAPSKKRPAPKKGPANATKSASKKRKLDNESIDGSPSRGTPATSRASVTPAPRGRKQNSATPTRSSSVAGPDDDDYEDENELFCICRKPDDHGVMIGCDGPCEDWFHLKCVEMTESKTKLVQKWYCPNCAALGNETLWKRMCRLPGCSKPARQDERVSKYCSDEHAAEYMQLLVDPKGAAKVGANKKKQANLEGEDEEDGNLHGGVLRPAELKALVDGVKDVNDFHQLGEGVLSPPKTASPDPQSLKTEMTYTEEETAELEHISRKKEKLLARRAMLNTRDRFVAMVEARHKSVLAQLKESDKSIKDICGYDTRLTWSDDEFSQWLDSAEGKKALESNTLDPPSHITPSAAPDTQHPPHQPNGTDTETKDVGGGEHEDEDEIGKGVCKKKRCERHRAWLKNQMQDNAFEKDLCRLGLKRLESDERAVRDQAKVRGLEGGGGGGNAGNGTEGGGIGEAEG